ncbi:hypothetical protein D8Y20_10250 [Mariprofundus sp. EBB-1]|nr:hypothetical protein D8Y20_10250 [Mariprofundus sp. EBB-1]
MRQLIIYSGFVLLFLATSLAYVFTADASSTNQILALQPTHSGADMSIKLLYQIIRHKIDDLF